MIRRECAVSFRFSIVSRVLCPALDCAHLFVARHDSSTFTRLRGNANVPSLSSLHRRPNCVRAPPPFISIENSVFSSFMLTRSPCASQVSSTICNSALASSKRDTGLSASKEKHASSTNVHAKVPPSDATTWRRRSSSTSDTPFSSRMTLCGLSCPDFSFFVTVKTRPVCLVDQFVLKVVRDGPFHGCPLDPLVVSAQASVPLCKKRSLFASCTLSNAI